MGIEKAFEKYGEATNSSYSLLHANNRSSDVVRIAPNEVAFISPQAAAGTVTVHA